jgi:GAF domain-containing protein
MQNRTAIFGLLLLFRKFQTICPLPYTWHLLSYRLQSLLAVSPDLPLQIISILMSQKLVHEFEILANSLKSGDASNQELSIPALAERIAKTLHVKSDEVAILAVSEKSRHLCFLAPQALRNVGHIPLSSTTALAARTVRDSRPEIVNNFATVRHASVFEGLKDESLNAAAIQRIISAPILAEGKVIGVIQISRKAAAVAEAGPELTSDDLGKLLAICKPLGKLMQLVAKD